MNNSRCRELSRDRANYLGLGNEKGRSRLSLDLVHEEYGKENKTAENKQKKTDENPNSRDYPVSNKSRFIFKFSKPLVEEGKKGKANSISASIIFLNHVSFLS